MHMTAEGTIRRDVAPQLHPVSRTAQILGVSSRTLWREIAAGNIPVVRVGKRVLVDQGDLEQYVAQRREVRSS